MGIACCTGRGKNLLLPEGFEISCTGTPLPSPLHRTLRREELCPTPGGRLVIVGDVHACASELRTLLAQVCYKHGRDTLVLVGDLVNKGPDSGAIIRMAREHRALCVRGNHDDDLLEAWYRVGRYSAGLDSYKHTALSQVSLADIEWLQSLPLMLNFPWLGMVVVHAGLLPGVPLTKQKFEHMLWMREVKMTEAGSWLAVETHCEGSIPWVKVWDGPEHVVFGHDAKRKLQQERFATGLDTGCCFGDKLTALVVDVDDFAKRQIFEVPAEKQYEVPADKATIFYAVV